MYALNVCVLQIIVCGMAITILIHQESGGYLIMLLSILFKLKNYEFKTYPAGRPQIKYGINCTLEVQVGFNKQYIKLVRVNGCT